MKQYCDENGYLVPAVLERAIAHEDPRHGLHALTLMCLYGIGVPVKPAPEGRAGGGLVVEPKYPIGTDPKVMDRLIEDEIARRGYVPGRRQDQVQTRDRGAIFNKALSWPRWATRRPSRSPRRSNLLCRPCAARL